MASIRKYGFWRHRPIAISTRTGEEIVICGNQRLKAARKLGLKSVPAIIYNNLDEQEENDIVLRDNINNGEWDFEALQDDKWGDLDFKEIGIDMPAFNEEIKGVKSEHTPDNRADNFPGNNEDRNAFYQSMLTDCLYESNNLFEIPNLRLDMQAGKLQLPFALRFFQVQSVLRFLRFAYLCLLCLFRILHRCKNLFQGLLTGYIQSLFRNFYLYQNDFLQMSKFWRLIHFLKSTEYRRRNKLCQIRLNNQPLF